MRHKLLCFLAVTTLSLGGGRTFRGQSSSSTGAAPTAEPRAEFLAEIAFYERRYARLAKAIPADNYTWRPAEGVRSIGKVFDPIVAANYSFARARGMQPLSGVDFKAVAANANDKPQTVQGLKDSFAHFHQAILARNDADAGKAQKMFGRDTTQRGAFIMITGHTGEHPGQSIAYARMNGIVPPWTADASNKNPQTNTNRSSSIERERPIVVWTRQGSRVVFGCNNQREAGI